MRGAPRCRPAGAPPFRPTAAPSPLGAACGRQRDPERPVRRAERRPELPLDDREVARVEELVDRDTEWPEEPRPRRLDPVPARGALETASGREPVERV